MGVENYHVIELVGEGSFGKVYKGRCKLTGQTVAMKFIMKHGKSDKDIHNLRQKIEILRKLKHENIIEMLDSFESPQEFCVVAEFARGELFEILEDDKNLPEEQVQAIAKQLDLSVQPGNYVYSSVKAVPSICESGVPSGSTIQESALEILDHYGNYAIECFEKGTTAGILRFKGGLAAFVESRATKHHKNGKNSYKDGVQKFFIISKQSNLLYIGVGCASKCKLLAERLTIEVVVSQVSQQHIARCAGKTIEGTVGIEKALQMAQKFLNKQAHSDPPNKDVFGGILIGHGPNKEYIAYYIGLSKTRRLDIQCISDYCFCPCGSGREFAVQILYELNVNPQGIAETAIDNIKSTITYTFVNTPKSGAETYVFMLNDGQDLQDKPNLILDPVIIHLENHSFLSDTIILLLAEKKKEGKFDEIEKGITDWSNVICASRLASRGKYWAYRIYYLDAQHVTDALNILMQHPVPPKHRNSEIPPIFEHVTFVGSKTLDVYAGKCSRKMQQRRIRFS